MTNAVNVASLGAAMTADSSGNVGVGTSSPLGKFGVVSGATFVGFASDAYTSAVVGPRPANDGVSSFLFSYGTSSTYGLNYWKIDSSASQFSLWQSGTQRFIIDSSSRLLLACASVPNVGLGQTGFSVSPTEMVFSSSTNGGNALSYWRTQSGNSFVSSFWNGTNNVGNISVTTSTTSYNSGSDYRLKNNIRPLTGALKRVAELKPVAFEWKSDGVYGESFVAHELQEVCPQAVTGEKDAVDAEGNPRYQGIDTSFLVATLTAAIQEQQAIITALTTRVAALENT